MATLVSTGQITIVDNNDAKPITAFVTASGGTQQIYSKDESAVAYVPDWSSSVNTLTAKVYVGGVTSAQEVSAQLTNRKWSNDLSTSLGSGTTLAVNTNLSEGTPSKIYYFEGDYTDPVTGLVSHVIAQITLSMVKTGTNAVYIQVTGQNVIEQATGSTKNTVTMKADLIRAAGIDNTGVTYRWFQSPHNAANQIDGNLSGVTTKYGFQDTAAANAGRSGVIGQFQTGSGSTTAGITTTNSPDNGWADAKALVIHESAVTDIAVFKVEAKDSDGTIYQQFFTVYDVSDPYDCRLISTSGDKLQNGVGSTDIYPIISYGSSKVSPLTGWTFTWYFYDRDGKRGAFVDTTRTAVAGGRNVTANTAGATGTITYDGTAITFAAGDIIKVVAPAGYADFYEVASATGNVITLRTPITNTWLSYPAMVAGEFVGGKVFVCKATQTTNGGATDVAAKITVTGDEIDAKGVITCEANRP
ncbi:conserved hypothetical protein [Pseudomonas sp. OF001]|uniref:hypothetical protein n=1 Tax=Pseudomonas sp. OF001 TaxID=2772300 RepID=UPI00191B1005|nr:hypothetical protein [Pseudomonas sp. OF001]CAD5377369.1 conserved hypothetical protein [Pseudomonas sp. OF001]